jgi:hypothetical protein
MNETNFKPIVQNGSKAVSPTLNRIRDGLEKSRRSIKTLSDEIADRELIAAGVQDTLDEIYAEAFVEAASETNKETGKLQNPNLDSQKAATTIKLIARHYDAHKLEHREILNQIQKKKNEITCEHERRGDLRTEVQLLQLLKDQS